MEKQTDIKKGGGCVSLEKSSIPLFPRPISPTFHRPYFPLVLFPIGPTSYWSY